MSSLIDRYVDRVLLYADKPESKAQVIRQELKDCLLQKVQGLVRDGLPREEAILEALSQHGPPTVAGYRLRAPFPWLDIRKHGIARGVIAIGPGAIGIFAFGGWSIGIFAFGGSALGVFALGGVSFGVFCAGLLTWGLLPASFGLEDGPISVIMAMFFVNVIESPYPNVCTEADRLADIDRPAQESSQAARLEVANEEPY